MFNTPRQLVTLKKIIIIAESIIDVPLFPPIDPFNPAPARSPGLHMGYAYVHINNLVNFFSPFPPLPRSH